MLRRTLAALTVCLLLTSVAMGQEKVVRLKTGAEITGKVTETDDGYVVQTRYGTIRYNRADVDSIVDVKTPQQEYAQRLASIDAKDAKARIELGQWALEKGLLEKARDEFAAARALEPANERAALLLREVEARIKRQQEAATQATSETPTTTTGEAPKNGTAPALEPSLLVTDKEISRIRLAELSVDDRAVRVRFHNNVVEKFVQLMESSGQFREPGEANEFRRLPAARQAIYIVEHVGADSPLLDDVQIESDPKFMADFKRFVWPLVAQNCASSQCHGAEKGQGKLKLWNTGQRNARIDYSNFLALDMYSKDGWQMVNRDRSEQSILLSFGLPGAQSEHSHPETPGLRLNVFTSRDDARYKQVQDWIKSLKGPKHPDYNIKYRPPYGPEVRLGPALPERDAPSELPEDRGPPTENQTQPS